MPITLPPISRRRFLAGSVAAAASLALGRLLPGADPHVPGAPDVPVDPDRFALLSDTHIDADPAATARFVNMFDNLKQVCGEVLRMDERPAAVLIDGDCAYKEGLAADYATFVGLLKPLREAGLPVHLALGNHDHRERFWEAIPPAEGVKRPVEDRHVLVVESPRADWLILDSLDKTNSTPGLLGEKQLAWLAEALDARAKKPALVVVHHDPDDQPKATGKVGGLIDTAALLDVLRPRKQVKALFYGHTHNWRVENRDGLHFVNFPPTAYVFTPGKPKGWVDARLADGGMTIELRCTDPKHPKHGERHELEWRA